MLFFKDTTTFDTPDSSATQEPLVLIAYVLHLPDSVWVTDRRVQCGWDYRKREDNGEERSLLNLFNRL